MKGFCLSVIFWQSVTCAKYYCPVMIAIDESYFVHCKSDVQIVTKVSKKLVRRVNNIYSKLVISCA